MAKVELYIQATLVIRIHNPKEGIKNNAKIVIIFNSNCLPPKYL